MCIKKSLAHKHESCINTGHELYNCIKTCYQGIEKFGAVPEGVLALKQLNFPPLLNPHTIFCPITNCSFVRNALWSEFS